MTILICEIVGYLGDLLLSMGGAAAVNGWRDIVYIVCTACEAGISFYCMPVQVVDYMSKLQSTQKIASMFIFKNFKMLCV